MYREKNKSISEEKIAHVVYSIQHIIMQLSELWIALTLQGLGVCLPLGHAENGLWYR